MVFLLFLLAQPTWAQLSSEKTDQDLAMTAQLREAFRQVEGLDQVTLEVRGGVAVLRGKVPSLEVKARAEDLATKLPGTLTVDNGLTIETDVGKRVSPALDALYAKAEAFLIHLPLVAVSGLVFFVFLLLGRTIAQWDWLFTRLSDNLFMQDLLKQVASFAFTLSGALIGLEILDATALVGAVLGTAGVLGVAIGFAFKDLAENSLASILLSLRQPFSPNDHVLINGQEGKVVRLTSRATILLTLDGNHLRIPNATVFKAVILNYTRNPERRFDFFVGIDTDESVPRAQEIALKILQNAPGVLDGPAPQCLIQALGDSNVNLKITGWVDQRVSDFMKVKSEAIRQIKEAFDEADIFMPEPIYKVKLEQTEARLTQAKSGAVQPIRHDISKETHLEERIEIEREAEETDLLDDAARLE